MAIFMFNLYNRVIDAGIKPKGIKTDAILVFETKEELEKHFTFNANEIGELLNQEKHAQIHLWFRNVITYFLFRKSKSTKSK